MANTMAMTARERYAEYATLKALGFGNGFVAGADLRRVAAASRWPAALLGIALTFPVADAFARRDGHALPGLLRLAARRSRCRSAAALVVGVVAAAVPAWRAAHVRSSTACARSA